MEDYANKSYGSSDLPVTSANQDIFCVDSYIDSLYSFVSRCKTPMTISIQGGSGSGKTSMMKMVEEKLASSSEKIETVWFNTWQFSQFNIGLTFSILTVLFKALNANGEHYHKVMNMFTNIAERPHKAQDAGGIVEEIPLLKQEFQAAVDERLKASGSSRLVIFVDNLARLQPVKMIDMLEMLKMFLDCENCVFVLAVDYNAVNAGVIQKYGAENKSLGRGLYDKIVQLPFNVPVERYNIDKFIRAELDAWDEDILKKNDISLYKNLIETSVGFNPRGLKRLINTFQILDTTYANELKYDEKRDPNAYVLSAESRISKSTRQRALFAVICLQTSFDKLYRFLVLTANMVDVNSLGMFTNVVELKENKELMDAVFTDENGVVDEENLRKIGKFIPFFQKAIRAGNSENVTDDEVLRTIISKSTITSAGAVSFSNDEAKFVENRKLVESINSELQAFYHNSVYFQPSYQEGTTEACGYSAFKAYDGFEYQVVYSIRHTIKDTRVVKFMVKNTTKQPKNVPIPDDVDLWTYCQNDVMSKTLGSDPLKLGRKADYVFNIRMLTLEYDYVAEYALNESEAVKEFVFNAMKKAVENLKVYEQPVVSK